MKILVFGDIRKDFKRLHIKNKLIDKFYIHHKSDVFKIYEINETDYKIISDDIDKYRFKKYEGEWKNLIYLSIY